MYILALETTGPVGSAALIDERGQITEAVSGEAMNHLKDLMPMAKRLLDQRGVCQGDLTAAAASVGPGSFTGIRIGVTSARAICQALDIPAISVPTLDSFKVKCDGRTVIAPIINARRGQVYGAVFGEDGSDILKSGPYMLTGRLLTPSGQSWTDAARRRPAAFPWRGGSSSTATASTPTGVSWRNSPRGWR